MESYVSVRELSRALSIFNDTQNGNLHFMNGLKTAIEVAKSIPANVKEVKRGTWILVKENVSEDGCCQYLCSRCHKGDVHKPNTKVPYCWNCGAEMNEEKEKSDV